MPLSENCCLAAQIQCLKTTTEEQWVGYCCLLYTSLCSKAWTFGSKLKREERKEEGSHCMFIYTPLSLWASLEIHEDVVETHMLLSTQVFRRCIDGKKNMHVHITPVHMELVCPPSNKILWGCPLKVLAGFWTNQRKWLKLYKMHTQLV